MGGEFEKHIEKLKPSVANQIAAGEVIERPSAALKELVENSIDAEATHIQVFLKEGGQNLIEVRDNGEGIHKEELKLAILRHATSKIRTSEDLGHIETMGFRGEALASIAAVSRLKIISRHEQEKLGEEIVCEASETLRKFPTSRAVGTTVVMEDLFFNTPARKKFLKSRASETSACLQIMHRIAMVHPNIHFEIDLDSKSRWNYPRTEETKDRILDVFRKGLNVSIEKEDLIPFSKESPSMSVEGYVLPMKYCLSHSRGIHTFVNQRFVRDKLLQQAILAAAKEVLFGRQYPRVFLHLKIDPTKIDVNVHPGKAELRFAEPNPFTIVRSSIREALSGLRLPLEVIDKPSEESIETHSSNAYKKSEDHDFFKKPIKLFSSMKNKDANTLKTGYSSYNPTYSTTQEKNKFFVKQAGATADFGKNESSKELFSSDAPQYLGTIKNTYLICQDSKGLLLVDQHAAHERVVYERFRKIQLKENIQCTQLLIPLVIELSPQNTDLIEECFPSLLKLGLEMERFGPNQIKVLSFPSLLLKSDGRPKIPIKMLVESLAQELEADSSEQEMLEVFKKSIFDTIATQSCHSSVRAGQHLSPPEAIALLEQMCETDFAAHCPHGRPTSVRFTWLDIEKLFKRKV